MRTYGIEMIAANRRSRACTQDGRPLRRIRRRWKIERFFAWLHNSRRVVTRWERHLENYLGMVQLACAQILLRAFMRWTSRYLQRVAPVVEHLVPAEVIRPAVAHAGRLIDPQRLARSETDDAGNLPASS